MVSRLSDCLATEDDPLLVPLRVAWLSKDGKARDGLVRLLFFGDPHDPGRFRKRWIRRMRTENVRVIVGDPATLSELRERWRGVAGTDRSETSGLSEFVTRQAALALDRAERRIRGMRYKVPRFVAEEILERATFRGGLTRLAWETGRELPDVTRRATRYMREIAAIAEKHNIPYKTDVYPFYGSDGEAFWRAGGDVALSLIGPGIDASHNYERAHMDGLNATTNWVMAYLLNEEK
jgi:glycerol-3-phosphate O-acyltransferase